MDADFVINLLTLGAPNVGKSQLIKRYLTQQFAEEYQPTGLEQLTMSIRVGTATAKMQIWDFGGRISLETDIGRKLIERGDIFLLCFNVADPTSLETVRQILNVVSPYRANAFVGLIGCKADLREELEKAAALVAQSAPTDEDQPTTAEETNKKNPGNDNHEEYASTPRPTGDETKPKEPTQDAQAVVPSETAPEITPENTPETTETPAPPVNLGVPREHALDLAAHADIPYFEVSAKTATVPEVQAVFHTALIYAYKKHLSKKRTPQEEEQEQKEREKETTELRTILTSDTPQFFAEFFSRDRMRSIFIELFKTRDEDLINYLVHKDILPKFLEASLLDFTMPTMDSRAYREFSVTALDNFYRLDPLFSNTVAHPTILDSLFTLFFNRPFFNELPVPRKRYLIRFLSQLMDTQTKAFIEYAHKSNLVRRLTEAVEFDDVKEVFSVLLASERKYVERSGPEIDFELLEKANIAEFLSEQILIKIGIVDSFFRVVAAVRGFTSTVISDIVKFNNFQICKNCFKVLVEEPSASFDVAGFFSDVILRAISLNEALQKPFMEVLSTLMSPVYSILSNAAQSPTITTTATTTATATTTTPPTETTTATTTAPTTATTTATTTTSKPPTTSLHLHSLLLVIDGLVRRNVFSVLSSEIPKIITPAILDILTIFFKLKFSNVIHFTIVGILVTCFEQQHESLVQLLLQEAKLLDKVLEFQEKRNDPAFGFYGHVMIISKYVDECPIASSHTLEKGEIWQNFIENSVKPFFNKSICPPGADLIAAKQRQIAKAGGSFLG